MRLISLLMTLTLMSDAALLPDLSQLGPLDLSELSLLEEPPPVTCRRGLPNDVSAIYAAVPTQTTQWSLLTIFERIAAFGIDWALNWAAFYIRLLYVDASFFVVPTYIFYLFI